MESCGIKLPKCAVLLAAYNGMQYIEEQLQSILNQQNVDVKIFISIDKSTDETKQWLDHLVLHENRVILLPYGEIFGGAARNFFRLIRDVDFSSYDFIAFSDQDDCWYSDKLFRACNHLVNSEDDAYSSNVLAFWADGKQLLINKAQPQKKWDYIFEAAGPGCTYVMTKKLMSAIKRHLIIHWEKAQQIALHDWFCYAYARAHDYSWYIDPIPTMRYRQHTDNQVGVNSGIKARLKRLKQIQQGWWFKQVLLITQLIEIENIPFVKQWCHLQGRDFLYLARYALQCRRSRIEALFMMSLCILLGIRGKKIE